MGSRREVARWAEHGRIQVQCVAAFRFNVAATLPWCARILYMTTVPLAEARASLSRLIDSVMTTHERVEVTRKGRRAAVILSADDFDSIMETLDILSDADLVREIRQADEAGAAGEVFTAEEVEDAMRAAGRLPK